MGERLTDGLAALQAANPWLAVFGDDSVAIAARVRRDDVAWRQAAAAARAARLSTGRDAWNAWALEHIARKSITTGAPTLAEIWAAIARFDIEEGSPGAMDDFAAWLFPGDVILPPRRRGPLALDHAAIMGSLRGDTSVMDGALTLERAHIRGDAGLRGARLKQGLRGYGLRIDGALDLTGAMLQEDLWLRGGAEFGAVRAAGAAFSGEAAFGDAKILGPADVRAASFAAGAGFDGVSFAAGADFAEARFAGAADFTGAHFAQTPCFDRARFAGAWRLEGASFPSAEAQAELSALAALVARASG